MTPEILFNPSAANLELVNGDIHVFCASLDISPMRMRQLSETLSSDECERAGRFHFEKDKNHFIAGRGTLREILGRLLNTDPTKLVFAYGPNGKPRLAESSLHFNLAHSDSLALYAVSRRHEVGVDIEFIRPNAAAEEIAARHFHKNERAKLSSIPDGEKPRAFFNCWTRKEAIIKASGTGLGDNLNQIDVFAETLPWSLQSLTPAKNYAAAVAANGTEVSAKCWKWFD